MKLILLVAITFGLLVSANNSNALLFNDHNYEIIEFAGKNWDDATSDMLITLGNDYHLATITTQEEQDFIAGELLKDIAGEYWLGGYQTLPNAAAAGWNWITGETWSYTNWQAGEPNDYYGDGPRNEQHLAIWKNNSFDYTWNDEWNVQNIKGYIAESAAPVPEPATMLLFGTGLVGLVGSRIRRKK